LARRAGRTRETGLRALMSAARRGQTMPEREETTLRLIMPQWQGGNLADYHFGTEVLAWLAPPTSGPVEVVPVPEPVPGETLAVEDGIVARAALVAQARAAREVIDRY